MYTWQHIQFPPVARKRWAASSSCGETFTLDSLSCLKAEKSLLFLLGATFFLDRLSAAMGKTNSSKFFYRDSFWNGWKETPIKLTVTVWFVQDLWFDYLLDHVLQCYQTHDLVKGISLPFIVHFLDNGQVRFSCEEERQSNWDFRNISPPQKVFELSFHPL